jgi:hypothetical protein
LIGLALLGMFLAAAIAPAAEVPTKPEGPQAGADDKLSLEQRQVGQQYARFEELLLRMAELSAATDPRRAALLRRAVAQSKDRLIGVQFETLVELIEKGQLSRAIDNQQNVEKDLQSLLELLLSENRSKQLESEKARLREYLKRLNAIINQQKGLQGRTVGGGGEPKQLAGEQAKLADKTGELARDIKANEEPQAKPGEAKPQDGAKPADANGKKPGDKRQDNAKPQGDAQGKGRPQASESAQAKDAGKGKDQGRGKQTGEAKGQPKGQGKDQAHGKEQSQGQDQGGDASAGPQDPSSPPPDQQRAPSRKRLEAARQRMREAEEKLKEAQRKEAAEKQEEALRELEEAKARLEEILRQLREEEVERLLAMLEARFAKMLAMQRDVLEGTVRLDKVPQADRAHSHGIEAGRLSTKEAEIDLEAEKAAVLLREDGTAVAFPEALGQLRQDIRQVVQRLAEAKVDKITQGIEEDIVAALEEMIQALQKAMKDRQQKNQPPMQPQQSDGQDPPLVDILAEVKMIRALQMRVNTRTERYAKLVNGEQAQNADLIEALRRLAERQDRITKITRDLHTGKNR